MRIRILAGDFKFLNKEIIAGESIPSVDPQMALTNPGSEPQHDANE